MGLSAVSAVGTINSLINGSGTSNPVTKAETSMSNFQVITGAAPTGAAAPKATESVDPQDRFLKLLVAQMKNQDPLNPLDNAQVTSQLAQISTVSGIDKLNATLQTLAAGFAATQSLEAAAMIGRGVLAAGSTLTLANGTAIGGIDLPQTVDRLVVSIKDSSGIVVHNMDLGPQPQGVIAFQWDGVTDSGASAAAGNYSFSVSAQQGDKKVDASALAYGRVNGVAPGAQNQSPVLDVGGLGLIGLSAIKQIL
jgi:flagellar basal-body rod modification protein FlgD